MVIAVNGKNVGGMTLTGLEIEFDLGGPDMTLLISRYKFPNNVQVDATQIEQSYITDLDNALNDDRQVGWIDFGDTIPTYGLSSHVIRPPTVNLDDNSTVLSESDDTDAIMDDETEQGIRNLTAQNALSNSTRVTKLLNLQHGDKNRSKASFVPICQKSRYGESHEINKATNSLSEKVPLQGLKRPMHKGNDNGMKNLLTKLRDPEPGSSDSEDENSDDGNAWCGCVCGQTHQKKTVKHPEIFWIQCDICAAWYDCSSTCVGFKSSDAETKSRWTCWGCPTPESDPSAMTTNGTTEISKPSGRVSLSPVAMEGTARQTTICDTEEVLVTANPAFSIAPPSQNQHDVDIKVIPTTSSNETATIANGTKHAQVKNDDDDCSVYVVNDMVYVEEHSWARVNNPEGIANVVKAYIDDDGDQVYDVRYVVGGRANGVLPEYLTRYFFS
jgi:hypothetical protein